MSMTKAQNAFYHFCAGLARVVLPVLHPPKVEGNSKLPEGPFVFCANHVCVWDCIIMAYLALPRRAGFMAKAELFEKQPLRWIVQSFQAFPVKRGTADMSAVKNALACLKEGRIFIIFPEGTRNRDWQGELLPFNKGTGFIALMSKVPVVPVFFADVHGFKLFRKVRMLVGDPIDFADLHSGPLNAEKTAAATERIRQEMIKLTKNAQV
ncbi:MAG: lysophospholipid acyltransferase family protein [Eubacteriales bacterium]|nr:lysophospholipid acyltransferase family protein [Eubacteriales bacterium]